MDQNQTTKPAKLATPMKCTEGVRPNASEKLKSFENSNPNFTSPGHSHKPSNSPQLVKSTGRIQRSAVRNPNPVIPSPRIRIKERKFVVAKKKKSNKVQTANPDCKCEGKKINGKCMCLAYETLRSSQEDFNRSCKDQGVEGCGNEGMNCDPEQAESPDGALGSLSIKRRRDKLMEEARESVPEPGLGRVFHLVKAFEKLLTLPKNLENKDEEEGDDVKKGMKWALPGLQMPKAPETLESSSSFCPDDLVFTAESLGFGSSQVSSSFDGSQGSSRRSSTESVRGRRTSSASSRNVSGRKLQKKKQLKATSQKPFKLRTEERGKEKEEEFFKKLQEMTIQEEKQRIPVAQGLPLTTDEPEIPAKPSVKECTRPLDIRLYSDVRAVERSDFDSQVAEKMTLIEMYRMERESLQKIAEEEEVKRLRKEQVQKAQPMPYFDKPFLPKRSVKQPTVPREPKFHTQHNHKKMKPAISWNDFNLYAQQ